jgi:rare lipoprotein A
MSGRRRWTEPAALILLGAALAGCGRSPKHAPPAPAPRVGAVEEGVASWYGNPYHGRATSSGEIYDMNQMTAAHRTLPLGTRVRVENLSNGRQVEVRINDRGPFVKGRIIDLSRAAAREVRMIGPGTARVRVRVIELPERAGEGFLAVQVGAFRERRNAERLRERLERRHGAAHIQEYDSPRGRFYRLRVGRESDAVRAEKLAARLEAEGLPAFVVRVDE